MYAYIKLISSGKFTTVAINQIKKYKKSNPNKIFQVKIQGEYYQCLVGATHESQEELADIIKNGGRVRFPPAALLSDLSETDDQTRFRKKSTGASQDNNTRDLLNKKLSAINKKTGESGVITSNIEKNTVVSDSEESSEDSDDEEINQESEKDGENKQDTKKDESRIENSKLIDETDENLDADLTQIIDPDIHEHNAGSIEEDGHKVYDSTNTEG